MSGKTVRAALTQTVNAYEAMPEKLDQLSSLASSLDAIRDANLQHHAVLAREAKKQGAQVICFGELFAAPYFALTKEEVWKGLAEPLTGPSATFVRALAKELELVIIAPIYELDQASGERFNTALVVDADGELCGFYSKTHIPHGSNEEGVFAEGWYFSRSTGREQRGPRVDATNPYFPVFETRVGRIGVAICYDRHFEGVMSSLAAAKAEIIFSPAVTFGAKSARMWPLEFAVDAARWRVFIGGSNRSGVEPPFTQPFFGKSLFAGPEGVLMNISDHPELIIADLSTGDLGGRDHSGWDLPRDWRPDIYGRRSTRSTGNRPWDDPANRHYTNSA